MRGSEGQGEGRHYPSSMRPPLPPSQRSMENVVSTIHKTTPRQGYDITGTYVVSSDVISFDDKTTVVPKHKRTPASFSDPAVSCKRAIENEALKDTGSDAFIRPPKTKVAKSKSDSSAAEGRDSYYLAMNSLNKPSKRQKQVKREKFEKLSVSKFPKSDAERPLLGRRSMTFVIDPRVVSKERNADVLCPDPDAKVRSKKTKQEQEMMSWTHRNRKHGADLDSSKPNDQTAFAKNVPARSEAPVKRDVTSRGHSRRDLPDKVEDFDRDGARNPLYISTNSLPIRPKSAGQLRYCHSDDSDESSLDGEIEIVDIDKELEEDPSELSPYRSEGQPLQVPEFFIDSDEAESYRHMPARRIASFPHQQHQQHDPHRPPHNSRHHPDDQRESMTSYVHDLAPRERHNSGESDLSAVSDTVIKPASNGRRRFMSEPEILRDPFGEKTARRGGDGKFRNTGHSYMRESGRDGGEMTSLTAASLARQSREKLYSDAMERVLSRYSEMAVREADELAAVSTKPRGARASTMTKTSSSGHQASASGFVIPPRKLKPINRQSRHRVNDPP